MELIADLTNNQLIFFIPAALAVVGAILLFTFGFKSPEQPPFAKLSSVGDDRKAAGKKKKIKEKKPANGQATSVPETKASPKTPVKETPPTPKQTKETKQVANPTKQVQKPKKPETVKPKAVETVEVKNKKNLKKGSNDKPVDFDDGSWEIVTSKSDKKKKQDSPAKKENKEIKKVKKTEKSVEIEKLAKEVVNADIREKEKEKNKVEDVPVPPVEEKIMTVEPVVIEEKKEKKKKVKKEAAVEAPTPEPTGEKIDVEVVLHKVEKEPEAGIVFDELGDVWTEAKQPKKSKKKVRRDN